jgi:hypothetical protein
MLRFACLALFVLTTRAADPPLPYVDTAQDNLMAMAGDVHVSDGKQLSLDSNANAACCLACDSPC